MRGRAITGLALLAVFLSSAPAHADEIRLKDGTKITGKIVGFEDDSFRVETAYGFALIRKDKVADINITATKPDLKPDATPESKAESKPEAKKQPESKPDSIKDVESKKDSESKLKSSALAMPHPGAAPNVVPAVAKESLSPANSSPELNASATSPASASASAGAPKIDPALPKAKIVAAAPPPPPPAPPPPPEPPVIRDEIRGNTYVNLTYGFQMYKAPSWEIIPAARKALPDAVAALGTYDQTTLLVIGREHTKDSLDTHATDTGKALSGVYENYRLISNKHVLIAGFPAVEQHARGTADEHDWSVVLVTFLKGDDAYTLLGMTWADSDLIQMQENVLSKAVNSLTFAAQ